MLFAVWELAFQMEVWFFVINVAFKLQGVHDAPNFITQEDVEIYESSADLERCPKTQSGS